MKTKHEVLEGGNIRIALKNVRISFPALIEPDDFNGKSRYKATFLINKDDSQVDDIKTLIRQVIKEGLKGAKIGPDKVCLRDGDDKDYDGYEGTMYFTAASKKAPQVQHADGSQINDEDVIYGGCYVNAVVRLWPQNDSNGKRVNGALEVVRFHAHGDRFGGGKAVDASDWLGDGSEAVTVDEDVI